MTIATVRSNEPETLRWDNYGYQPDSNRNVRAENNWVTGDPLYAVTIDFNPVLTFIPTVELSGKEDDELCDALERLAIQVLSMHGYDF